MVVGIFRSRLRPDLPEDYALVADRMLALAQAMPGFRSFKSFSAEDGERLSLFEFESLAALEAWRDHPEHREAQTAGRARFYTEYQVQICDLVRSNAFEYA